MSRDKTIKFLRTTKSNLDTQKAGNNLIEGEPYLITDEGRLAIGTGVGSYSELAKKGEGGFNVIKIIKSSNELRYNTNTYEDDDDFVDIELEANSYYAFEFMFHIYTDSTPKFKAQFSNPQPFGIAGLCFVNTTSQTTTRFEQLSHNGATSVTLISGNPQSNTSYLWAEGILWTGSNAGTFKLQWAQSTATLSYTEIGPRSYMKFTKIGDA